MSIKREVTVNVKLTPDELAAEFADMDGGHQAEVLNEIGRLMIGWETPMGMDVQLLDLTAEVDANGARLIEKMAEALKEVNR